MIWFLLLRWGSPYRVKADLELKILLPQCWDYRHTWSTTSSKCDFWRTWGYSWEVRCFLRCTRSGVRIPTQKVPLFQNISRGCDQGKAKCLVMEESFVSDNYFLLFLSGCYFCECVYAHICIYKYIYINIYKYAYAKTALKLPPLPRCDASFLILEMLKLNDEAILITSWETKTTFRWWPDCTATAFC